MACAARRYLDLAERYLQPQPCRLVAIGGLSGAGKSTLAEALAPELGLRPGARVLLGAFGAGALANSGVNTYTGPITLATNSSVATTAASDSLKLSGNINGPGLLTVLAGCSILGLLYGVASGSI